ncbi:MAG: topoisomerase [Gammaproteobacteria bacterium]|jgi:putative DNA primase/helicase|nr:topoisomerase [Gammaproteobacteria bacterium]
MQHSTNPVIDFTTAIEAAGLGNPGRIIPDGQIRRFHVEGDRPGSRNGWYCIHLDDMPAGVFGSWKAGITETWCSVSRDEQTPAQRDELGRLVEQAKRQRDQEQRRRNAKAAATAADMIERSRPADPNHPYLVTKQIRPHGIRQLGDSLLIPVTVGDEITSVQTIQPDGRKRFLTGGRINGGRFVFDDETRHAKLMIAEGIATAATIHEETRAPVYAAFNANNLLPVARFVRQQHPRAEIVIAGDNDQWTEGNPGATKARRAAVEIGAKLLLPDFSGFDLSSHPTDFNDLIRLRRAAQGAPA